MVNSLVLQIGKEPYMQVLRGLFLAGAEGLHLRKMVRRYNLSPAGVADILRRINKTGLLNCKKRKNKKIYSLNLPQQEATALSSVFSIYENLLIQERVDVYSKNAAKKFAWMDNAYKEYKSIK